ncbi:hypothetical protein Bca52824_025180 [Brassica carinata]|uniref:Uncharacterized protein n=1 Tax=Brassica carinata TaxID=52824 RepID=A0A8X7VKZ4_BRACI|nr:hypothetical protein Bca52824_025180 [Brassica carinata]
MVCFGCSSTVQSGDWLALRERSLVSWLVGFEGTKLRRPHWFLWLAKYVGWPSRKCVPLQMMLFLVVHCMVSLFASFSGFDGSRASESRHCQGHMNLAFVRIWSETCPSDCEGTVCRATHSQSFAHQTRDCSSNGEVWGYGFLMTCSKISKHVFSSNMQGFGNLRSLNLTSCKRPTQFPDLLKATNLEAVKPSSCVNWEV